MKKLTQYTKEILLDYLDGNLNETTRAQLEKDLITDPALQNELDVLRKADHAMRTLGPETPSKNFTSAVMNRLQEYPVKSGPSIRRGIFLLSGVLVVTGIAIWLLAAGVFDHSATLNPNELNVVKHNIRQTLPSVSIDGKLIMNVIVILNLAVMFIVLDRAILKPLFRKRLQMQ